MSSLYNRYNPKKFKDIIGQKLSVKALQIIAQQEEIPNCILLTGIHGVGKTALARIFTKAINCEKKEPCLECDFCQKIENKTQDFIEVDGATYTGVDNIRRIIDNISYIPNDLKYKVYIIDEVHMLSRSAFDALLMTLQEPPSFVKFIFATTKPEKLPDTFLSRCLQIDLNRINLDEIENFLDYIVKKEDQCLSNGILKIISDVCEGSIRRAMSILELILILNKDKPVTEHDVRDYLRILSSNLSIKIFVLIMEGKTNEAIKLWHELYNRGYDEKAFFHGFSKLLKNLCLLKLNNPVEEYDKYMELMKKFDISVSLLFHFWEIIIGQREVLCSEHYFDGVVEITITMLSTVEDTKRLIPKIEQIFKPSS